MALPPGIVRATQAAQSQLNRAKGVGDSLLTDVSQQAEALRTSFQSGANSNISVIPSIRDTVGKVFEGVFADIQESANTAAVANQKKGTEALQDSGVTANTVVGATENILKGFASFNYRVTLACLTVNELNFPDSTYRVKEPEVTVLRSGGGAPGKALTAYETSDAQLEYFIDEINVDTIIAPTSRTRTSNATVSSFTVTEPYSMGLFLQTMMIAANNAGHADYLKAPYALIIEFLGYDDNGKAFEGGKLARRVFPIKINKVDFDVTASGSVYNVTAHAWNESSLSTAAQVTRSDITITGDTVQELLQGGPLSLTNILNQRIRTKTESEPNPITKDEYIIMFPKELSSSLGLNPNAVGGQPQNATMTVEDYYRRTGATNSPSDLAPPGRQSLENDFNAYRELFTDNNISRQIRRIAESTELANDIAKGTIAQSMAEGGAVPFGVEKYIQNENGTYTADNITISNNFRTFQFPQGTSIEQVIEEIVILSTYGQEAATQFEPDNEGMIPWFRIQTQCFLVPDEEVRSVSGENPKVYVYAVVPYRVHSSQFKNSSQPSVGIEERKAQAAKTYDYIYTGQNDDIIDFEINFNNAFFKAVNTNLNGSGTSRTQTRDGTNNAQDSQFTPTAGSAGSNSLTGNSNVIESGNSNTTGQGGGSDRESPAIQVARNFNEAIVNSNVDLITMELTILGDPYYLADTGQGNYSSPSAAKAYTADGTMDYQRSEVEVLVNFRTPIDYNPTTGGMTFPQDSIPVKAFSGLYKVNTVKNQLSGGKFTQVLELIRRPKQDDDVGTTGSQSDPGLVESSEGDDTTNTQRDNPPPASSSQTDEFGGNDQI